MNERIQQLAKQAGMVKILEEHAHEYGAGMFENTPYPELEKFAELIVRECVEICNQAILQNQDTLSKLNVDELAEKMVIHGSINQAQKLGNGIKQHFGVEE